MLSVEEIRQAIPYALQHAKISALGNCIEGKVRDAYVIDGKRVLVTTDRVSAFDQVLGAIPYKGQILNQLSLWWFEKTRDIVGNHVISTPDPNVTLARDADALQVEVIVRGFITGASSTSLWTLYQQGVDRPYGLELPNGLRRNDPLPAAVVTPTSKASDGAHDERLTCDEVVQRGLVPQRLWQEVQETALELFRRGQEVATRGGLILVDTKYEFGLIDGKLSLIDEVHTPDSSRYWVASSYQQLAGTAADPEQFDKEVLRAWLVQHGYRGDGDAPTLSEQIIIELSQRYISAYERLTGLVFEPARQPALGRIQQALTQLTGGLS